MKSFGTMLAAITRATAALGKLAAHAVKSSTRPGAITPDDYSPRKAARAARRAVPKLKGVWARLVYDSARGPAYRVHDPKTGRVVYVPLQTVPMNLRRSRHVRRHGVRSWLPA